MTAHVATSRDETVGAYGKRSDGNGPSRSLVRKPDAEDLRVPSMRLMPLISEFL